MRGGMAGEVGVPLGVLLHRQALPQKMRQRLVECAAVKAAVGGEPRLDQNAEELRVVAGVMKLSRRVKLCAVEARDRGVFQLVDSR